MNEWNPQHNIMVRITTINGGLMELYKVGKTVWINR